MAPEQLRAETPGPRTDVFALGVIAYEMLSGELPFSRGSADRRDPRAGARRAAADGVEAQPSRRRWIAP